jgi:hypothetical protein
MTNKKASQDPNTMDPGVYNSLVGRARLRSIRLTESRFELKPEGLNLDPDSWRNNVSAETLETFLGPDSKSLYGILGFEAACRQGRKRVLSVRGTYLVSYKIEGECEAPACELFVERVGKVATYPYFRALVATLTSQAGLMMQPLPVMSLAPRSVISAANLQELEPDHARKRRTKLET